MIKTDRDRQKIPTGTAESSMRGQGNELLKESRVDVDRRAQKYISRNKSFFKCMPEYTVSSFSVLYYTINNAGKVFVD